MRLHWTTSALDDLAAIRAYIARDDRLAAKRMAERILAAGDILSRHPRAGRSGGARGERELVIAGTPYILFYRIAGGRIDVLAVIHGARHRRS